MNECIAESGGAAAFENHWDTDTHGRGGASRKSRNKRDRENQYYSRGNIQGLVASVSTVGSVLAIVLSGAFFDHCSVKCVLIILLVCSAAGAAISCCSLFAAKK